MNSTRFRAPRRIVLALFLLAPRLVFAQAAGPQKVRIPPPAAKAKPKTDRSTLPSIPIFKDIAKDVGVTVQHIAAPEARYVIDSTSGGQGFSIAMMTAGSTSSWSMV